MSINGRNPVNVDRALPAGTNLLGITVTKSNQGTLTDRSGTITTGATAQQLAAANASRVYLFIQNLSTSDLWINFTTTAVQNQPSLKLPPDASFVMEAGYISIELVSIIGPTTGQAFVAKEG